MIRAYPCLAQDAMHVEHIQQWWELFQLGHNNSMFVYTVVLQQDHNNVFVYTVVQQDHNNMSVRIYSSAGNYIILQQGHNSMFVSCGVLPQLSTGDFPGTYCINIM